MNVDILMRDKTVEELDALQTALQKEMEEEREELREMVGRRYRDVLDASAEVRTVHKMAEEVVTSLTASRSTHVPPETLAPSRVNTAMDTHKLIALHYLLPLIGNSPDLDSLNSGYALVLAEQLHRSLLHSGENSLCSLLPSMGRRIALTRKQVVQQMAEDLSSCSRSDWASNELASICLVEGRGIEELLDEYLKARKCYLRDELETGSLLTVVKEVKETLTVVECLFSQGELLAVLQSISAPHFRPQVCMDLEADSAFSSFSSMISQEMEKVNRQTRERKLGSITTQKINDKCEKWIDEMCTSARSSVSTIMEYYENLDEIIQFIDALEDIVGTKWPRIGSTNSSFFTEKLLGSVVVERFKSVVSSLISSHYSSFSSSLHSLSSSLDPPPLFEKRRTKFDPLMARGISHSLNQSVLDLLSSISSVRETVTRFEKAVGVASQSVLAAESTSTTVTRDSVRDALADEVVQMVQRVCSSFSLPSSVSPSHSMDNHLFKARVALALLQSDPATMCKVLNRDGIRISACSTLLHTAIDESLSSFVNEICCEFVSADRGLLSEFILSFASPLHSMDIAMEWDKIDLPEVGQVHVPLFISAKVHNSLVQLCRRLSSLSLSHLLSRSIRVQLTSTIARHLVQLYTGIVTKHSPSHSFPQRILLQLLFDTRVLSALFPIQDSKSGWKSLSSSIESLVDPFDLSLLSPLLTTNTKIAMQRIQLTIAPLLLDIIPSKDSTSSSLLHLIDILPRSTDDYLPRIPPIPRLDRASSTESSKTRVNRSASRAKAKNSLLMGDSSGMPSNPSISSFVNKISSTWFGS
ncbi:cogc-1 [Pristionchus pacificus]|nr:cogc-1 [Pristionchus pacificus]